MGRDQARQDDVRSTAEDLVAKADEFDTIEAQKARLDASDPRTLELAEQATRLAREMAAKAEMEEQLIRESQAAAQDPGVRSE